MLKKEFKDRLAREPRVMDVMPVRWAVYLVCLIHLIVCMYTIDNLVQGTPMNLEGVLVSPFLQCCYGAFSLVSIIFLILAAIGALYLIETHLKWYGNLMVISALIDFTLFWLFIIFGRSCAIQNATSDSSRVIESIYCGIHDVETLLCLVILVLFKVVAVLVCYRCRNFVCMECNKSLHPFVRAHLSEMKNAEFGKYRYNAEGELDTTTKAIASYGAVETQWKENDYHIQKREVAEALEGVAPLWQMQHRQQQPGEEAKTSTGLVNGQVVAWDAENPKFLTPRSGLRAKQAAAAAMEKVDHGSNP